MSGGNSLSKSLITGTLPVEEEENDAIPDDIVQAASEVEAVADELNALHDPEQGFEAPVEAVAPPDPEVPVEAESAKPSTIEPPAPEVEDKKPAASEVLATPDAFSSNNPADETKKSKSIASAPTAGFMSSNNAIAAIMAFCGVITIATFATALSLGFKNVERNTSKGNPSAAEAQKSRNIVINTADMEYLAGKPPQGENPCEGKKPDLPNVDCIVNAMVNVGPQAGANVTKGYRGELSVDHLPIDTPYWQNGLCPVNVHWHLGAEHYSLGQYDETGSGPENPSSLLDLDRRLEESERKLQRVRGGYQCKFYNDADETFNTPYVWEHCVGMEVGETYEVHWPHSAAGACGTPNQYQTPFYDGVFCRDGVLTDTAKQIGVQAQVFTIVNDEAYYYPDLMRGMIVDGAMGQDIAMYTGSTTGTTRDNEICSQFSPITWQVDRKCHLISASSFDKMCMEMKAQRDDMSGDLYAHGSRELVADELTADNQANRALSGSL